MGAIDAIVTNEDLREYFIAAGSGDDAKLSQYLNRPGFDVNITDDDGDAALYWATSRQRPSTVKILLDKGADPNIIGKSSSPLRAAAGLGNIELIELLLSHGAYINGDWNSDTPLNLAIKRQQFEAAKYLLSRGANPNQGSGPMNDTPLMGAAMFGNTDLVETLIAHGADVNSRDIEGDTPLVYLTIGRTMNTKIAKSLLLHGARIDDLYSRGHVFMRFNFDGSMGTYPREAVTRSVLLDDDVTLAMMNPQVPDYSRYCY